MKPSNGVKNLTAELEKGGEVELTAVAFTPKPRTVKVSIKRDFEGTLAMGGRKLSAERFVVHPEIPPNTGNVIRLAANTGCELHLIEVSLLRVRQVVPRLVVGVVLRRDLVADLERDIAAVGHLHDGRVIGLAARRRPRSGPCRRSARPAG